MGVGHTTTGPVSSKNFVTPQLLFGQKWETRFLRLFLFNWHHGRVVSADAVAGAAATAWAWGTQLTGEQRENVTKNIVLAEC